MKKWIALFMAGFSCLLVAAEKNTDGNANQQTVPEVEEYTYSMHLDIARVISHSEVPNVCAVVPVQMTYEDHRGQRHTLEYEVMGNGCGSNN